MGKTSIEWTATVQPDGTVTPGYTFNPWVGCAKVHQGCANCYAERDFDKRRHFAKWGPHGTRVLTSDDNWKEPTKWNKKAAAAGKRAKVFCASLADVFEDWTGPIVNHHGVQLWKAWNANTVIASAERPKPRFSPLTMNDVRRRLFALIDDTPWLDWLLLTKRPENIRRMMPSADLFDDGSEHKAWFSNVQLGTSISDQASADTQVQKLLKCRDLSPVLFLSIEPLLGPVNLSPWLVSRRGYFGDVPAIDCSGNTYWKRPRVNWVIVGGESGPGARPMHPNWVRSIRDQCHEAGTPFFFKQWGAFGPEQIGNVRAAMVSSGVPMDEPTGMFCVGKAAAGRILDGRTWDEFPVVESGVA